MGMREVQSTYTVSIEYDKRLYEQDIAGSIAPRAYARQAGDNRARRGGRHRARAGRDTRRDRARRVSVAAKPGRHPHEHRAPPVREDRRRGGPPAHGALPQRPGGGWTCVCTRANAAARCWRCCANCAPRWWNSPTPTQTSSCPATPHLQRAQPVLFAHHMLAYFRDVRQGRPAIRAGPRKRGRDAPGQRRAGRAALRP